MIILEFYDISKVFHKETEDVIIVLKTLLLLSWHLDSNCAFDNNIEEIPFVSKVKYVLSLFEKLQCDALIETEQVRGSLFIKYFSEKLVHLLLGEIGVNDH